MASGNHTVTAAELVRNFGRLRQSLGENILFVTHHGRETHVLMSKDAYEAVAAMGGSAMSNGHDNSLPGFIEAAAWIGSGLLVLDPNKIIRFANDVAASALGRPKSELEGRHVYEAIPEFDSSLARNYLDSAMLSGQPDSAELPSLIRKGNWVRFSIYPTTNYAAVLFQDITRDVETNRLADAKRAIIEAMSAHGGIGYIRVNVREQIVSTDKTTEALVGLEEGRLLGVKISDLVPVPRRVEFREALNGVLEGDGMRSLTTSLYCNDGHEVLVSVSIVSMSGAYGSEGAVLVFTRR